MKPTLSLLILLSYGMLLGQTTTIPDPNFEQRLIDMGYDTGPVDGSVPTANINTITDLYVPNSMITDVTGIEDFTALEIFDISGNGVSFLNLGSNLALRELYTETNPIAQLDVSSNVALEIMRVGYMLLTELDVSNNLSLTQLTCQNNSITELDLTNNTSLTIVVCAGNQLCSLDLSNSPGLTQLICAMNNLTRLDVKNGQNSSLVVLSAFNNDPDMCLQVDDAVAATAGSGVYGSWVVDATITYSEACSFGPQMALSGNGMNIAQNDTTPDVADDTDFGQINFGQFVDHSFTITNSGDSDLVLNGSPLVDITGSTDFIVISDPVTPVAPSGGTTSFTLRYIPSMAGTINTATVSIDNNDCLLNPFTFTVRGESSSTLSTDQYQDEELLKIFPNPSAGEVFIKAGIQENFSVDVFDITGRKVLSQSINQPGLAKIDLGDLKGVYLLIASAKNTEITKKLVIY